MMIPVQLRKCSNTIIMNKKFVFLSIVIVILVISDRPLLSSHEIIVYSVSFTFMDVIILVLVFSYIVFLILGYLLPLNGKYITTPRPSYEADNSEYLSINPTITGGVLGSNLYVFYSSIIKSTILVIK